jgi:copper homeostasis protein
LSVMIRPRPGDFCYSDQEFEVMKRDVERVRLLGADGLVFGILTRDGDVDVTRTRALVERARPCSVTFHRAFDEARNLQQAIKDLKSVGVERLLTSGGKGDIDKNAEVIAELVQLSRGAFKVMAGGGVTYENVMHLVRVARVDEVHVLSAVSRTVAHEAPLSGSRPSPRRVVDVGQVRRLVQLLRDGSHDSRH